MMRRLTAIAKHPETPLPFQDDASSRSESLNRALPESSDNRRRFFDDLKKKHGTEYWKEAIATGRGIGSPLQEGSYILALFRDNEIRDFSGV